ncbi:MAG: DUF262 domain-containing protein [Anaerolineales bacterium]|nr:DUF262 domain-containing protein [Anaerolineales bacterium]
MAKKFEAHDSTIEDVLFGAERFKIPRYQRPYAWGEDQIAELWADLEDDDASPFLGSFILNDQTKEETGFVEVIDGQQRILSLMILMAALRNNAKAIDEEWAKLIQRKDIAFEGRDGNQTYRVLCGDSTHSFFEENILAYDANILASSPKTKEHEAIKKNYLFLFSRIQEIVKDLPPKKASNALRKLRESVENLTVIHIRITGEDEAYEIFEATNARGVELSVADLLKNLIFRKIKETRLRDDAKEKWLQITGNIEETDTEITKFIRYYWISKYGFVTERKLFKEVKKTVENWEQFLNDLVDASRLYYLLLAGSEEEWRQENLGLKKPERIHKTIVAVRLMNVSQCHVFFMGLLRNLRKINMDPTNTFQLVENFTFNYSAIAKQPGNKVERIYSKYSLRIEKAVSLGEKQRTKEVQRLFASLAEELKNERPNRSLFKDEFMNIRYRNTKPARLLVTYILSRVNDHFEKTAEKVIDFSEVNIEHFLPQKPSKQWNLTVKEVRDYVNLLGNLTLVSKGLNSSAGNGSAKEKVQLLEDTQIMLTQQLLETVRSKGYKWDKKMIEQRQEDLERLAYEKVWDY